MEKLIILKFPILLLLLFVSCNNQQLKQKPTAKTEWTMTPDKSTWPDTDYFHPPLTPFDTNDYVIQLQNMSSFYLKPGEFGYFLEGRNYGFDSLSFILTNTQRILVLAFMCMTTKKPIFYSREMSYIT
jgi:hypothetical protein